MSHTSHIRLAQLLQQLAAERGALAVQSHRVGQVAKATISSPPILIMGSLVGFIMAAREPSCAPEVSDQSSTVGARPRHHGLLLLAIMLHRIKRSISSFTTV